MGCFGYMSLLRCYAQGKHKSPDLAIVLAGAICKQRDGPSRASHGASGPPSRSGLPPPPRRRHGARSWWARARRVLPTQHRRSSCCLRATALANPQLQCRTLPVEGNCLRLPSRLQWRPPTSLTVPLCTPPLRQMTTNCLQWRLSCVYRDRATGRERNMWAVRSHWKAPETVDAAIPVVVQLAACVRHNALRKGPAARTPGLAGCPNGLCGTGTRRAYKPSECHDRAARGGRRRHW